MAKSEYSREKLMDVLSKLNDDSLKYVWRPIMYAYLWTEQADPDSLTDDDMERIQLYGAIANGPADDVKQAAQLLRRLDRSRMEEQRKAAVKEVTQLLENASSEQQARVLAYVKRITTKGKCTTA